MDECLSRIFDINSECPICAKYIPYYTTPYDWRQLFEGEAAPETTKIQETTSKNLPNEGTTAIEDTTIIMDNDNNDDNDQNIATTTEIVTETSQDSVTTEVTTTISSTTNQSLLCNETAIFGISISKNDQASIYVFCRVTLK